MEYDFRKNDNFAHHKTNVFLCMTMSSPCIFYAAACMAFILSGVFCSVVRWSHMCKPYYEMEDYFYPARKYVSFFYFFIILQFPYLYAPSDEDTWLYIRAFGIIYYPLCFSVLFLRYFDNDRLASNRKIALLLSVSFALILFMLVLTLLGDSPVVADCMRAAFYASGAVSVALTAVMLVISGRLKKKIGKYHYDSFSNEDDFPYKFAARVVNMPLAFAIVMWILYLTGSHWFKMAVDIVVAVWMVGILTVILHPQRGVVLTSGIERDIKSKQAEIIKKAQEDDLVGENENVPAGKELDKEIEQIKAEIYSIVVGKKRFLDPHFNLDALAGEMTLCGRTKLARVCARYLNGFYYVVNIPRVEYAEAYLEANPNATKKEVALASGFTSRDNYKHAVDAVKKLKQSRKI